MMRLAHQQNWLIDRKLHSSILLCYPARKVNYWSIEWSSSTCSTFMFKLRKRLGKFTSRILFMPKYSSGYSLGKIGCEKKNHTFWFFKTSFSEQRGEETNLNKTSVYLHILFDKWQDKIVFNFSFLKTLHLSCTIEFDTSLLTSNHEKITGKPVWK